MSRRSNSFERVAESVLLFPVSVHTTSDQKKYLHGEGRGQIDPEPQAEVVFADHDEIPDFVSVMVNVGRPEVQAHVNDEEHIYGIV